MDQNQKGKIKSFLRSKPKDHKNIGSKKSRSKNLKDQNQKIKNFPRSKPQDHEPLSTGSFIFKISDQKIK